MDANFWINFIIYIVGSFGGGAIIYGIFCHLIDRKFKTGKYTELDEENA